MRTGSRIRRTSGSVLSFVVMVFAIALVTTGIMLGAVQMATVADFRIERRQQAEDAARNAILAAAAQIKSGQISLKEDKSYAWKDNFALLTFNSGLDAPFSTNNLESSSAVSGWSGRLVPPRCVHLVAVGESGGQKVVRELMVSMDSFPWSVASNGRIQGNDVQVYAVESLEDLAGGVSEDERLKSDILSNGSGESIFLSGNSEVEGNAKAVGGIRLEGGAKINGEQLGGQTVTRIEIDKTAKDYDPRAAGKNTLVYGPSVESIEGRYDYDGDLTIGDLKLADGILYVRGNVTVTGKITGKGAIVAEKNIKVTGSMATEADMAALVAGEDIEILGTQGNASSFQGLVLAEGSFTARDTQVVGTVVSKEQDGTVELERVTMVRSKDLTSMDLNYDVELQKVVKSYAAAFAGGGNKSGDKIGLRYKDGFLEFLPENYDALKALALRIKIDGGSGEVILQTDDGEFLTDPPSGGASWSIFNKASGSWAAYESQVKTDTVVSEPVFQLDFNEFLRTKGSFRPVYQHQSPFEKEDWPRPE